MKIFYKNFEIILKTFFYVYPLIFFFRSGAITGYIIFLIIISFYYLFKKKLKVIFNLSDYLIFAFFFLLTLSTLINIEESTTDLFLKSIFNIRFAFLYLAIRNLFYYKVLNFKIILIVTCLSTTFLSIDIFVQHIYKKDIFGFEPWHGRYAGLFIDEAIAGSYIQKFSFISILTVFVLNISTIQKKLLVNIIVIVLGLGILMSTDRAPFIVYLFQVIILIILSAKFRSIYLISFILLCVISILIFKNNSVIKDRYLFLNNLVNFDQEIYADPNSKLNDKVEKNYNQQFLNKKIFEDDYFKIFYSGYVVWKENPILGTGNKSFNKSCSKLLELNKDILCAPHTHNLYLEILVNIGGIGFFLFLSFVFSIFFTIKKNFSYNPKIYLFIIIILIAELLPLRSYGSIFTTVNGSIFWYLLALASSNLHVKK
jgi:hypothetical protein